MTTEEHKAALALLGSLARSVEEHEKENFPIGKPTTAEAEAFRREQQCPRCHELLTALKKVLMAPLWVDEVKLRELIDRTEKEWV